MHTLQEAVALHRALPQAQSSALSAAGIGEAVVHARLLGWDGEHITIPVFGPAREIASIERATFDENGVLRMLQQSEGQALLFNQALLEAAPPYVVVTEDIADALVLLTQRFDAIAIVGDVGSLLDEALEALLDIREVIICFRRGPSSEAAAWKLAERLPHAQVAQLPESVGENGSIGTFFVKQRKQRVDFLRVLATACHSDGSY